jgi:hypothetical protein
VRSTWLYFRVIDVVIGLTHFLIRCLRFPELVRGLPSIFDCPRGDRGQKIAADIGTENQGKSLCEPLPFCAAGVSCDVSVLTVHREVKRVVQRVR